MYIIKQQKYCKIKSRSDLENVLNIVEDLIIVL